MADPVRAVPRKALSLPTNGGANQSDKAGADLNVIVAQYKRHGTLPAIALRNGQYGDFTLDEDLHAVHERLAQAADAFAELPASVRTACGNDYVRFLELVRDPAQRQVLVDAGLVVLDTPAVEPPAAPAAATPPEGEAAP